MAHDFRAEKDEFLHNGDWNAVFVVAFRDQPEEERLHCEAPIGEHFVRFWLTIEVDQEIWETKHENILRVASRFDVAVEPGTVEGEKGNRRCRLCTRAWLPGFSQRIFGLTLSNLMECKGAVLAMLTGQLWGHVRS